MSSPQVALVSHADCARHDPGPAHPETARLVEWAHTACGGRVVSVLEGGYDLGNLRRCTAAHVAALAGIARAEPNDGDER